MAESEHIKIKKGDLVNALMAAFEAGWSGTPEVAESVALTIIAGLTSTATSPMDDRQIIQKLAGLAGKGFDREIYGKGTLDFLPLKDTLYELGKKGKVYVQPGLYTDWEAAT